MRKGVGHTMVSAIKKVQVGKDREKALSEKKSHSKNRGGKKPNSGAGASCLLLGPPGSNWCFSFAPELVGYSAPRDLHRRAAYSICESCFLIHQDVHHDLFVCS